VTRKLDEVVRKALSPEPDDRFATAGEFGSALRDAAGVGTERAAASARRPGLGDTAVLAPAPAAPARLSIFRTWFAVPLLIVVIAAIALGAGVWLGKLELGGPVGIQFGTTEESPAPATRVVPFESVAPVDPYGDGDENKSGMPLVDDGDPLSAWKSENYYDGTLNKPGVGMLFDLGSPQTVTGFRLQTPHPGYRFSVVVGDGDWRAMVAHARRTFTAVDDMRESIEPATGRYVLLWITTVVDTDDGNRAEVSEFRVVGPA
jgi:putative peptidoglycan lipid II flippase